jgi:hypothetical protein
MSVCTFVCLSRSWNPDFKLSVQVLKPRSHLSVCRDLETYVRLSRSWNLDLVYSSVEVLKPRSQIECRGLETQILSVHLSRSWNPCLVCLSRSWNSYSSVRLFVCPSIEVLKPRSRLFIYWGLETHIPNWVSRSWNPNFVCLSVEVLKPMSRLSVCRGLETQIPSVRLSRSWNPDPKLRYSIDSRTAKVWKSVPPNSRAQKLFRTSITHFYFFTYWVPSPNAQASNYLLGCLRSKSWTVKKNLAWAGRRLGVWNRGSKY